jgi:hypothetical protein
LSLLAKPGFFLSLSLVSFLDVLYSKAIPEDLARSRLPLFIMIWLVKCTNLPYDYLLLLFRPTPWGWASFSRTSRRNMRRPTSCLETLSRFLDNSFLIHFHLVFLYPTPLLDSNNLGRLSYISTVPGTVLYWCFKNYSFPFV